MYNCPHCKKPGISVWRKLCLGPALPAKCKKCGKKVGVPNSGMAAGIPFLIAILAAPYFEDLTIRIGIWVVGAIIMAGIHLKLVPLIKK